jgi:Protein of unknown function (DUF4231)
MTDLRPLPGSPAGTPPGSPPGEAGTPKQSKERGVSPRFARLWSAFGVPRSELDEVKSLGDHILLRLQRLPVLDGSESRESQRQRLQDWVNGSFTRPLRALLLQASRNERSHAILNLAVIVGGFATSGIAVAAGSGHRGSNTAWIVFSFGLVVALAGGISQLFRPGYRATQRVTLATELRDEGWAFANASKDYKGKDNLKGSKNEGNLEKSFGLFDERVSAINRRSAEIRGFEAGSRTRRTGTSASRD